MTEAAPVDALLLLSFGGPDGQEDVIPVLENVTRDRGVPPERLEEVAAHYRGLGCRSPLNDLHLEIIDQRSDKRVRRGPQHGSFRSRRHQ